MMAKSIVNLTTLVVCAEVEEIVETQYPYQRIFANSDLRQELIAYVLTRVRNIHITVENEEESQITAETVPYLTELKLQIEDCIHQGICHILQKYKSLVSNCISEENCSYITLPYWTN